MDSQETAVGKPHETDLAVRDDLAVRLAKLQADVDQLREMLAPVGELLPHFLPGLRAKARLASTFRRGTR